LLINNLISNATRHSSTAELNIQYQDNELIFYNMSKAANQAQVNLENAGIKHENSEGIGQGLFLVKRIVESLNWQYDIQQTSNQFKIIIKLTSINQKLV